MDLQEALGNHFERPVITATEDLKENRKREYSRYSWAASNMVGVSVLDIGCVLNCSRSSSVIRR